MLRIIHTLNKQNLEPILLIIYALENRSVRSDENRIKDEDPDFQVYPNPSTGIFNLEYSSTPGDVRLTVCDITGRKVFEQQFSNPIGEIKEVINLTDKGPGVYFLRLVDNSGVLYKRIVVE